jgi:hypothetical protein
MKFTGISVLVSALWLIGAFGYELVQRAQRNEFFAETLYGACMMIEDRRVREEHPPTTNYGQCRQEREEALAKANSEPVDWRSVATIGFIPLPFLWLGVFLAQRRPRAPS